MKFPMIIVLLLYIKLTLIEMISQVGLLVGIVSQDLHVLFEGLYFRCLVMGVLVVMDIEFAPSEVLGI